MYSFFYGTFTRSSIITLTVSDEQRISGGCLGLRMSIAPTIAANCSIAHTLWKKRKQIKRRQERRGKTDRMCQKYKKSKVVGTNNLKL